MKCDQLNPTHRTLKEYEVKLLWSFASSNALKKYTLESGDSETQKAAIPYKIFIKRTHKIPRFIQLLCTQKKFPIRWIGTGKMSRVDSKLFNKFSIRYMMTDFSSGGFW